MRVFQYLLKVSQYFIVECVLEGSLAASQLHGACLKDVNLRELALTIIRQQGSYSVHNSALNPKRVDTGSLTWRRD